MSYHNHELHSVQIGGVKTEVKVIIISTIGQASASKTLDLTSYGLASVFSVQAIAQRNSATAADFGVVQLLSTTNTTITYMVATSNTVPALGGEGLELDSTTDYEVTFVIHAV